MPLDPSLEELSGQQQRPEQPAVHPWLKGALDFSSGGLTGAIPGLHETMPALIDRIGRLFQTGPAQDALSAASGIPAIEAIWTPRDIDLLKKIYSANIHPSIMTDFAVKYLGRTKASIWQKANELGITKPPEGPYVRFGSPSIANDPERAAQIAELLKKGMSSTEISSKMGDVSARTIRRYINENLNRPRAGGRGGSAIAPSMPVFNLPEGPIGDDEFERVLNAYLATVQGKK